MQCNINVIISLTVLHDRKEETDRKEAEICKNITYIGVACWSSIPGMAWIPHLNINFRLRVETKQLLIQQVKWPKLGADD
jgi:hypothetical protein